MIYYYHELIMVIQTSGPAGLLIKVSIQNSILDTQNI